MRNARWAFRRSVSAFSWVFSLRRPRRWMPANPPKVLVVDDEPQIRTLLKATLSRAGYAVIEAANGKEALNAKAIDKPDLVLLDLGLPDRDGLELVAKLREEPRS